MCLWVCVCVNKKCCYWIECFCKWKCVCVQEGGFIECTCTFWWPSAGMIKLHYITLDRTLLIPNWEVILSQHSKTSTKIEKKYTVVTINHTVITKTLLSWMQKDCNIMSTHPLIHIVLNDNGGKHTMHNSRILMEARTRRSVSVWSLEKTSTWPFSSARELGDSGMEVQAIVWVKGDKWDPGENYLVAHKGQIWSHSDGC